MAEKLQEMEALLKDLGNRVGEEDKEAIRKMLDDVSKDLQPQGETDLFQDFHVPSDSIAYTDQPTFGDPEAGSSNGESEVSAGVGSTGALDRVDEDFNRNANARASGFMGKNSEITWMQRVKQETYLEESTDPAQNPDSQGGSKLS